MANQEHLDILKQGVDTWNQKNHYSGTCSKGGGGKPTMKPKKEIG